LLKKIFYSVRMHGDQGARLKACTPESGRLLSYAYLFQIPAQDRRPSTSLFPREKRVSLRSATGAVKGYRMSTNKQHISQRPNMAGKEVSQRPNMVSQRPNKVSQRPNMAPLNLG